MRVALTGGSGFVGSHAVEHLLTHGHAPRLLVRSEAKAARVLAGRGIDAERVELVVGDMLDVTDVAALLDGADAAVHAAAAIGMTGPVGDLLERNVTGTRNVVGRAVALGLDPVVYVSSVAVFVPPPGPTITTDGPLASPHTEYGRSKVEAERYVRGLQAQGAPVTVVYPGGVVGPGQPELDGMMEGLVGALGKAWPMPRGGVAIVHVSDVAEAIARCIVPGLGPRRFLLGGEFLTWPALADLCEELTGARYRRMLVPAWALVGLGAALDLAKRVRRFHYPLTRDAAVMMATMVPTDDRPTIDTLGLELRPAREIVAEAITILAAEGHLAAKAAGRLAP